MLAHRWGILCRPLCCDLYKVGPLVMCLCRLHNYCTERVDSKRSPKAFPLDEPKIREEDLAFEDEPVVLDSADRPATLLQGGHHFQDVPRGRRPAPPEERCPMDDLIEIVRSRGLRRPPIRRA